MRVEVYWNLHKKLWSIRALEGPDKGRVIGRFPDVWLTGCKMVVQPAGRDRVRRERKKNVHAFVRGTLDPGTSRWLHPSRRDMGRAFTYNPYRDDTFKRCKDDTPIHAATFVKLSSVGHDIRVPRCLAWEEA